MGICTSQTIAKQGGRKNSSATEVAMVIQLNGKLQEFRQPIKANDIISQNPNCFICSSESMNIDSLVPQMHKDEFLQLGQLYFVLPLSMSLTPLSLHDLCALAIKASTVLNNYYNPHHGCTIMSQ